MMARKGNSQIMVVRYSGIGTLDTKHIWDEDAAWRVYRDLVRDALNRPDVQEMIVIKNEKMILSSFLMGGCA